MKTVPGDFHCRRCGACCRWPGHVLLNPWDITKLADSLGLSESDFIRLHTVLAANRRQLSLAEKPGGACCFLSDDNTCAVYNARPQQCIDFPTGWRVKGCPYLDS